MFGFFIGENFIGQGLNETSISVEGLREIITLSSMCVRTQAAKLGLATRKDLIGAMDSKDHDLDSEVTSSVNLVSFCTTVLTVKSYLNIENEGGVEGVLALNSPIQTTFTLIGDMDSKNLDLATFCTIRLVAKLPLRLEINFIRGFLELDSENSQLMHTDLRG